MNTRFLKKGKIIGFVVDLLLSGFGKIFGAGRRWNMRSVFAT
jgi:hypothetical protein